MTTFQKSLPNPTLEKGTDAYYQEVAKVFNRVVERTQPSYTTMQRSALLRNPNEAVKLFTMYMTQRSQNFNLLYDSVATYKRTAEKVKQGKATAEELQKAKENLRHTVTSQLAASGPAAVSSAEARIAGMPTSSDR